ncbi:O-antigen ligase family protein [Candidatus Nomurabacteria bacterium]|nr:O-antigen ligase family protein [Candidatus Nomurabacteria bacterium]MCB9819637.1 O-antigen ligase family protein [Candidatus Nomurabacteria bacterium]
MKDLLKWVMYGAVFAVPFVLLLVSSTMFFPYITGKNFAFRILVEIGFTAWLLLMLIDRAYRPQLSYILYAILGLLGVMLLANLFGEYSPKSFWSNYERMEGWVTLLHFSMYFVVLGSALTNEKLWNRFFNIALVAGAIMSLYALAQASGIYDISQGTSWRVDGRLGNSSYLGVYMLFHIFIAGWLFIRAKSRNVKFVYGGLIALFIYILTQTGTRGAVYGLIGGSILSFLYLAIMAPKGAAIKKWALGGFLAVVLLVCGMWSIRDTEFVKNNPALDRFTGTTLAEGNIRFTVWQMALEGVKERPILGWGQENFSYVFNKYYDPALYGAEPWYDRTHNIFMDWLIAGGILGLVAYLAVLVSGLWYSVLRPFYVRIKNGVEEYVHFSVYEQALILGLLAAYMFHNLFVFDNLASWIFYAVVLALIHSRVSYEWMTISNFTIDRDMWNKLAVPSGVAVLFVVIYFVNIPSIQAAQNIIDAYRATTPSAKLEKFETAFNRGGLGDQEIFEQSVQVSAQLYGNPSTSEDDKEKIVKLYKELEEKMMSKKPNDARLHIIASNFYRITGDLNSAMTSLNTAEELSPNKQTIKEEQGVVYMMAGKSEEALERFQTAYLLDERNEKGKVRLAAAYLFADKQKEFEVLLDLETLSDNPSLLSAVVNEPLLLSIAYQKKNYSLLELIIEERVVASPLDTGLRTNLSALYFEQGQYIKAKEVIEKAIEDIPEFKSEGEALLKEIDSMQN